MHKYTRYILGNPSQQGRKTQPNPLLYSSRERPFHHQEYPSTQEGAHNPGTLAPKRGAQLWPRSVLAEISKTHKCVCVYNEIFPLTYIRLLL